MKMTSHCSQARGADNRAKASLACISMVRDAVSMAWAAGAEVIRRLAQKPVG